MTDIVEGPIIVPDEAPALYAEITRLRAEVERVGRDYNTVRDAHDDWVRESERLRVENEQLKRSRDRYRAAWEEEKRRSTAALQWRRSDD
jgi:regulator of replication initiation timing